MSLRNSGTDFSVLLHCQLLALTPILVLERLEHMSAINMPALLLEEIYLSFIKNVRF